MSFKPEQIVIPWKNGQEIPIGVSDFVPVELRRSYGTLSVGIHCASEIVPEDEETPEGIIRAIDHLINHFQRLHPKLLRPRHIF